MHTQKAKDWPGIGKANILFVFLFSLFYSLCSFAESGRDDYDLDDDGLIEINDLADLDNIRNNLKGKSLYSENTGCPLDGCNGFELTTDLDFDTNQDGVMDAEDEFWNGGEGWLPIGDYSAVIPDGSDSTPFSTFFDGNGFEINNLYINRVDSNFVGLFGYIDQAHIRKTGLVGALMSITGKYQVGPLVGSAGSDSLIISSFSSGTVQGLGNVGGLVGRLNNNNKIISSYATGNVLEANDMGGLVGSIYSNNEIISSFSSGNVLGKYSVGGLIGDVGDTNRISVNNKIVSCFSTGTVHGKSDLAGGLVGKLNHDSHIINSFSAGLVMGGLAGRVDGGVLLGGLVGHSFGNIVNSYWATDSSGQLASSGSTGSQEYLGLKLTAMQCAIQANSSSVNSNCVSADGSWEGAEEPIVLYQNWDESGYWTFGSNRELPGLNINGVVYRDSDVDGIFDFDDQYPFDTDNDGTENVDDAFPLDATESLDSDNDGIGNNVDIDDDNDGLIEVSTLNKLNAMRFQRDGEGYRESSEATLNKTGCPVNDETDLQYCRGYELTNDFDFDTNQDGLMNDQDVYWNAGAGWLPIGSFINPFTAIFEGNGHEIKNLYINRANDNYVGLFSYIDQAQIRNIGLKGPLMSVTGGRYFVGALVGYVKTGSVISNSHTSGIVSGGERVGGLIGYIKSSNEISASYSTSTVHGLANYVGGLIGFIDNNNQITNSYSNGVVTGNANYVGGLIGYADVSNNIINSYNLGQVQGDSYVGGLLGLLGSNNEIAASFNVGPVLANENSAGGLVGLASIGNEITSSFNTGAVQGPSYAGGLIGYLSSDNSVQLSFNAGVVSGGENEGGLIGFSLEGNTVENSYWAVDSSTQATSAGSSESKGYVGLTLEELQCAIQFSFSLGDSFCASSGDLGENLIYWDFGNSHQLPGLNINGDIYRDSDGDGSLDLSDSYPLDSDNDGFSNQEDRFPFDPAASIDADQDGYPDAWLENCDSQCLERSTLILDAFLNDTDNDGVSDEIDRDYNRDDGAPQLNRIPDTISVSVNNDAGTLASLSWGPVFFSQFEGFDVVDGYDVSFEASLNGRVIVINDDFQVSLPSGYLEIDWVAIDTAGNRSNIQTQIIKVYPQVRFAQIESISGDQSTADVLVELSGESPSYPVTINWNLNRELSAVSLNQNDFGSDFNVDEIQQIIIQAGDDADNLNTQKLISLAITDNSGDEYDEVAVLDLIDVLVGEDVEDLYTLNQKNNRHTLTIAYQNLAPSVQLLMEHDAREIPLIEHDMGLINVTAVVSDGNDLDNHTLEWDVRALGLDVPEGNVLRFDSSEVPEGNYRIAVVVTDSGENSLSSQVELEIKVIAPAVNEEGSGSLWWLSWILFCIATCRRGLTKQRPEI